MLLAKFVQLFMEEILNEVVLNLNYLYGDDMVSWLNIPVNRQQFVRYFLVDIRFWIQNLLLFLLANYLLFTNAITQ